jgi:hypothetical protein
MGNSLSRVFLLTALTLGASASHVNGAPVVLQRPATKSQKSNPDFSFPSSVDVQTQESLVFTGRLVRMNSQFVLDDPTTKVTYQLNDQGKARQYLGRQVKVTGKLQMDSNTIQVERIDPLP